MFFAYYCQHKAVMIKVCTTKKCRDTYQIKHERVCKVFDWYMFLVACKG